MSQRRSTAVRDEFRLPGFRTSAPDALLMIYFLQDQIHIYMFIHIYRERERGTSTILYYTILYSTLLYSTLLYCTVLYCSVPYCTVLYYTILYCTILYYTILYYTILYYTILYYTILYYTILYYTILYYTILYYTILYYTILYYTILYYTVLPPPPVFVSQVMQDSYHQQQLGVFGSLKLQGLCLFVFLVFPCLILSMGVVPSEQQPSVGSGIYAASGPVGVPTCDNRFCNFT